MQHCEMELGGTPGQNYTDAAKCGRIAVTTCDECEKEICPSHNRVCPDSNCRAVLCFAPMEGCCFAGHVCKKPIQTETISELVERVMARELA